MEKTYMLEALKQAQIAFDEGEVPVGAVIVKNGKIIASSHNRRERGNDATAHAEILSIREACETLGTWRLSDCEMYVTLEPCPMCAGAIVNARLKKVHFAAKDARGGAFGSVLNLNSLPLFCKPELNVGECEVESTKLMRDFFKKRRTEN